MESNQKKTLIIIAVAVAIVVLGALGVRQGFIQKVSQEPIKEGGAANEVVAYSPEVPENIELTIPVIEAPANPEKKEEGSIRLFNISISKTGFSPNEIVVNEGDTVGFSVTAVDGDYDFDLTAIGGYQFIKKGEKRNIGFQALRTGTFTFSCRDYCPAEGKLTGKLIVK